MKFDLLRALSAPALRTAVLLVVASSSAGFLTSSSALAAASINESVKLTTIKGSASNTITSLIFNDDGTISIESDQVGHLTHFGNFTGHFSYVAVPTPAAIFLTGQATLTNNHGEKLFLTASIVEVGTGYPYTVNGILTITGGTARYLETKGLIRVTGEDTASLTDTLNLEGVLAVGASDK